MNSRQIRLASLVAGLVVCTSCSRNSQAPKSEQSPDVGPSAAPGIAFTYDYQFSLPDKRIAAAEEAQASSCEKLGLAHCRITGMRYNDQNDEVSADLELRLDASIARAFGKFAEQAIEGNEGKLVRFQIGSSDEGAAIAQATRQQKESSSQIAQLRQEISNTKAGSDARSNLFSQLQAVEQQGSDQAHAIEDSQAALATTPMIFRYYGRGGMPGFRGNPIHEAWITFVSTIVSLVGFLLEGLAVLVPFLVLVAAIIGLWRTRAMRVVRDWIKGPQEAEI